MKRKIEVFTAGCPICDEQIEQIKNALCPSCEMEILNVKSDDVAFKKSKEYGIKSIPSVVIDGVLSECCKGKGIDLNVLRSMGLGVSI